MELFHQVIHGGAAEVELRYRLGQVASVRITDSANIDYSVKEWISVRIA